MRIFATGATMSTLYVVATPIGNLSDITLRALDVLKNVSLIISEDTRETSKVLKKYDIDKQQISYRDQNHDRVLPAILSQLALGYDVALVSDSGTPLISDPGFKLVRELISQNIKVEAIPGPSAVISALTVSGLPTDKFTFLGFLPRGDNQRMELLKEYGSLDATLVIYESPFRVLRLLGDISEVLGNRYVCIVKDLTKIYEKVFRGNVNDLLTDKELSKNKGEFVILIAKEDFNA